MSFDIIVTDGFLKSVKRIYKKHKSILTDLEALEQSLTENPTLGTSLRNNLFKIRLAISNSGKGKSGGARIITYVKVIESKVYLAEIYLKSEISNIDEKIILQRLTDNNLL